MGILSRALHAARVVVLEEAILNRLRYAERVASDQGTRNIGVDIPMRGPGAEEYAAALDRILKRHPSLAVVKFADHFTLAERGRFQQGMNSQLFNFLSSGGQISNPGERIS